MSAQDNLSQPQMEKFDSPTSGETMYLTRTHLNGGVSSVLAHPVTHFYNIPGSTDEHGTPVMWDVEHTPPHIDNLFAHGHSATEVAAHVGTVALESLHRFGELPNTTKDIVSLSKHSAPLVNKVNKALGRPQVEVDPTNLMTPAHAEIEIQGAKHWFSKAAGHERHAKLDPSLVKAGSELIRSTLSHKQNLNKQQFGHQEELPF